jgi:lipopolysaccharide transport system ATP-binding protein
MTDRNAIEVSRVSKRYLIGAGAHNRSLIDSVAAWSTDVAQRIRGRGETVRDVREFWALRDVSFAVSKGESVGIIGPNGAGKSTLLKILSRITEPTSGRVRYVGRVGSLLEVGTGFHSQLSGRDNIFLSGAVLGMRRREIARKFDEIVDFANVEEFIDTPVKRYSSGMYLRLAFAVAAHLETDILLVDEVLAVGDAAFQKKCLGRMSDVSQQGRTILFVSHNLTAVRSLCRRAILLDHGAVVQDGHVEQVLGHYYADHVERDGGSGRTRTWGHAEAGGDAIRMLRASVRPIDGGAGEPIDTTMSFVIECDYAKLTPSSGFSVSMRVHDEQGLLLFDQSSWDPPDPIEPGAYRTSCTIPGNLLNDGFYFISFQFRDSGEMLLELPNALRLQLLDGEQGRAGWFGDWEGVLRPRLEWSTRPIADEGNGVAAPGRQP